MQTQAIVTVTIRYACTYFNTQLVQANPYVQYMVERALALTKV